MLELNIQFLLTHQAIYVCAFPYFFHIPCSRHSLQIVNQGIFMNISSFRSYILQTDFV